MNAAFLNLRNFKTEGNRITVTATDKNNQIHCITINKADFKDAQKMNANLNEFLQVKINKHK